MPILAGLLIEAGHMARPERGGPDPFSMASEQRLRALLAQAGFTAVRTEELPVQFAFSGIGDYLDYATDTGGLLAPVLRALSGSGRAALAARLETAFAPFAAGDGYVLPGLALNAAAGRPLRPKEAE